MKPLLKSIARWLALVLVSPLLAWHWLWVPLLGRDKSLEYSFQVVSLIPGLLGNYLRTAFLRGTIRQCHPTVTVCLGTLFSKADTILEENVYIGPYSVLGLVTIEKDALIASGVQITSGASIHGHADLQVPMREQPGTIERVTIGSNVWVGSGAIVMASIAADSIVGAGSVVNTPIPSKVIAVGVPARVVKERQGKTVLEEPRG